LDITDFVQIQEQPAPRDVAQPGWMVIPMELLRSPGDVITCELEGSAPAYLCAGKHTRSGQPAAHNDATALQGKALPGSVQFADAADRYGLGHKESARVVRSRLSRPSISSELEGFAENSARPSRPQSDDLVGRI
jgi:hypothetical protein